MTAATPSVEAGANSSRHSQWIDLLRGLSALAVVLFHVRVDLWIGWKELRAHPETYSQFDRAVAWLSVATPFFGSAVMLFFLVSGFCVHLAYAASQNQGGRRFEIGPYARRRFFRIYPPYLAIVIATVLIERLIHLLFGGEVSSLNKIWQSVFMVQNYGLNAGQLVGNPSLWSLPVEVELYLAYPLFLWASRRAGFQRALFVVALISAGALALSLQAGGSPGRFHFAGNFLIYWIIWCGGAWLGHRFQRQQLPRWNWALSALSAVCLGAALLASLKGAAPGALSLVWASFYFLLMLWGLARPDAVRWPSWAAAPLSRLGQISYSLYLVHFPFFGLCGALWLHQFGSKPANFLIPLAFVALSLPVAALFYRLVEAPSHGWARNLVERRAARRAA